MVTVIVMLLLLLAGIGGIAYANRKSVLATAAADKAKIKAEEAKIEAEAKAELKKL